MKFIYLLLLSCLLLSLAVASAKEPITPITSFNIPYYNIEKSKLGRLLFADPRLSGANDLACTSCHNLQKGGADPNKRYSIGANHTLLKINTPSVLTAALNFKQFWDGRANTLEEQASSVILNPSEMNGDWSEIIQKLQRDNDYVMMFKQSYPEEGITKQSVTHALAEFQRSLVQPSNFDSYLLGDKNAINDEAKRGYTLFKQYGCIACHQGINVGGNVFQAFGVVGNYFSQRGNIQKSDYGRFNVTQRSADKFVFKVPSLRNVSQTAPYFHDGSATTLKDAVDVMFKFQLGRDAPEQDKALIIKFLETLDTVKTTRD